MQLAVCEPQCAGLMKTGRPSRCAEMATRRLTLDVNPRLAVETDRGVPIESRTHPVAQGQNEVVVEIDRT